jgi:transcriptional regulator with XRE-family HTH domain
VTFIERVDSLLKRKDLDRKWLAYTSGVSYNTISGWYSKGRDPKLVEAEKIAKALNVSIDWLQTGDIIGLPVDDDLRDMCELLMNMSHDELIFAKGWLAAMQASQLRPKTRQATPRQIESPERDSNEATG